MGGEAWTLHEGTPCDWRVTPKHTAGANELVALIIAREDSKYAKFARVKSLELGSRKMVESEYAEECLIMHLIFPSDDKGLWAFPLLGARSDSPFLPSPQIYYRLPESKSLNPAAHFMAFQGRGFRDFYREAKTLRNGTADNIPREYQILFGEPFPS